MKGKIHGLLTPDNCMLILVDFQPQMAFAVNSIDDQLLINNAVGLARSAKIFRIPTILTTVAEKSFSGPMFSQLQEVFPDVKPIDRTNMNFMEDEDVVDSIKMSGRKKLLIAGLWTEICVALPAINALEAGYEVYVVADACGDVSEVAHDMAMHRMIQAGAVPVTWLQVLLELQRDWARQETYDEVLKVAKEHAGAYGVGIQYAEAVLKK
ncbi:hydrolase [Methanocella sp. CWC-04]|uniref:Hydrolase n=1 Tax=Methanooceanicella nereidis TaxID=2052831 RepID=A0AAP2RBL5_9EURY|nr:hydrolase [Methanocella sp. CWC-04]MCD1294219.1 hydrolase [Methanocella sp. CWC-04]